MTTKNIKFKPSITARTAALISKGIKTVGLSEAYFFIEEDLHVDEAESVMAFCFWLENNQHRTSVEVAVQIPFIEKNYTNLYKNFFLKGL